MWDTNLNNLMIVE
jgi:hypothetical protein